MAPPSTYLQPHVQLGQLMLQARRRGLSFEEFWDEAMRPGKTLVMVTDPTPPAGAVRWPTDGNDRASWRIAILDTRTAWRRSYERDDAPRKERAIAYLAGEDSSVAA